ncbi:MAG: hypothetical protein Q9170_006465, partial [Blastenia crenularia]
MLADTRGISFPHLPQEPLPVYSTPPFLDPILDSFLFPHRHQHTKKRRRRNQDPSAGPSGGYLHHVLQTQLSLHPNSKLHIARGRNADVVEYAITQPSSSPTSGATQEAPEGEAIVFKAARYYGFRNIQNLVRKLKPPKPRRLPGAAPKSYPLSKSNTPKSNVPMNQ